MKLGIETYYRQLNENGGIEGRKVHLTALDDGYEPAKALPNMKELYEQRKVFAVIGNVGTPTAEVTVPYALEKGLPFFGAFTGAGLLRKDPPDRFVFNYRASYAEETGTMIRFLVDIKKLQPDQIAVFAQDDGYGKAGFTGVVKAMRKYNRDETEILHVKYPRNTLDVDQAVGEVLKQKDKIKAIVMVPAYRPAALFIKRVRESGMSPIFLSVSFVGSEALAEELKEKSPQFAEGVIVTQVVPHYDSKSTAVLKYRAALKRYYPDELPSFISLEGYIAASLLAEGMQKASDNLTTDSLVEALESIQNLDIGIGAKISYGLSEHQGSHKVWGTILDKTARYQMLDME
jgi:ABC-type branched-subunit amino acid transport system substrate-binding protein